MNESVTSCTSALVKCCIIIFYISNIIINLLLTYLYLLLFMLMLKTFISLTLERRFKVKIAHCNVINISTPAIYEKRMTQEARQSGFNYKGIPSHLDITHLKGFFFVEWCLKVQLYYVNVIKL